MEKENNEKNLKNERKSKKINVKVNNKKAQKDTKELIIKKEKKDKTGAGKIFRRRLETKIRQLRSDRYTRPGDSPPFR